MHPYYHGGLQKQTAINWINVQELGCLLFQREEGQRPRDKVKVKYEVVPYGG